jgi:hypothetical protein
MEAMEAMEAMDMAPIPTPDTPMPIELTLASVQLLPTATDMVLVMPLRLLPQSPPPLPQSPQLLPQLLMLSPRPVRVIIFYFFYHSICLALGLTISSRLFCLFYIV